MVLQYSARTLHQPMDKTNIIGKVSTEQAIVFQWYSKTSAIGKVNMEQAIVFQWYLKASIIGKVSTEQAIVFQYHTEISITLETQYGMRNGILISFKVVMAAKGPIF